MSQQRSPQPDAELEQQLAFLATELLGWDERQERFTRGKSWLTPLLTGNGMLEIIEAMREQRFSVRTRFTSQLALLLQAHGEYLVSLPSALIFLAPDKVARAAYAALQETAK